jgi:hypothetical protein
MKECNTFTPEQVHIDYTSYTEVGEVAALLPNISRESLDVFIVFNVVKYAVLY